METLLLNTQKKDFGLLPIEMGTEEGFGRSLIIQVQEEHSMKMEMW